MAKNLESEPFGPSWGVVQGPLLSPLLFVLARVISLEEENEVKQSLVLFADDVI